MVLGPAKVQGWLSPLKEAGEEISSKVSACLTEGMLTHIHIPFLDSIRKEPGLKANVTNIL